jgi:hypothetical protein
MDYGIGDVAVGQQSTHATRRIQTRAPEDSGLTTGHKAFRAATLRYATNTLRYEGLSYVGNMQ